MTSRVVTALGSELGHEALAGNVDFPLVCAEARNPRRRRPNRARRIVEQTPPLNGGIASVIGTGYRTTVSIGSATDVIRRHCPPDLVRSGAADRSGQNL
jgi:hypothetical protein